METKHAVVLAAVFSVAVAAGCGGSSPPPEEQVSNGREVLTERAREDGPEKVERKIAEGKKEYRALGLSFLTPESTAVIVDKEDEFVLGDPDWERMSSDYRFDEPLGLMVSVRAEQRANLGFLDGGLLERLPETVMLGNKTFEQYVGRETIEYEQREVHSAGYLLLARTPSEGGHYLLCKINYVAESGEAALQKVREVAGSFMAVNPEAFTDEIPLTAGLDSMLRMRIPQGMNRAWNRSDYFRIQTYDSPYTYFEIKTGRRAREEINRLLRQDPEEITASRDDFFGYPVLVIHQDFENGFSTRKIFETCLPGNDPVFLTIRAHPEWLEEHGDVSAILDTLEFELPRDAGDCPQEILKPVLEHFGMH